MNQLPQVRSREIIDQELGKELLIYDLQTNTAYSLNETSKVVYQACVKKLSFDQLKRQHKLTDDLIFFALDELNSKNLLENYTENNFSGLTRREVIRRVGMASMVALPLISSVIAPKAANAASGSAQKAIGDTCTGGSNDPTCPTNRCSVNNQATLGRETCCIPETTRANFTCVDGDRDCCLGNSGCVNGTCCRNAGSGCGSAANSNLCCSNSCTQKANAQFTCD